jgi:hypothetical protein
MGNTLTQELVDYIPGHLALLYHVDRMPELTTLGDALNAAIKRFVPSLVLCPLHLIPALHLASFFTSVPVLSSTHEK